MLMHAVYAFIHTFNFKREKLNKILHYIVWLVDMQPDVSGWHKEMKMNLDNVNIKKRKKQIEQLWRQWA